MPRTARQIAANGCYHVIQRGISKQIIFEDDEDYCHYLDILSRCKESFQFKLYAYCLMDNHVHLLLKVTDGLSQLMKKIGVSYAVYYNKKYEREGYVFQNRYKSEVVESGEYFLTALRYILNNPQKANVSPAKDFPWSSFQDYMYKSSLTDTGLLYKLIGGKNKFNEFMDINDNVECMEIDKAFYLSDKKAMQLIKDQLGLDNGREIQEFNKYERNAILVKMRNWGLSVRQMERLTGISRGVITRVLSGM